jgi:gliding motility-associated-like protein
LGICDLPVLVKAHTEPVNGVLTISTDGSYTYLPTSNYHGTDSFTYQICDLDGDCSTATVTITVKTVNDLPLAIDDKEDLQVDGVLEGSVGDNDTLSEDGGNEWSLLNSPSNGKIVFNPDGTYIYTPNVSYMGSDSFTYELCDLDGDCSQGMATVTIEDVLSPNQILTPNGDGNNDTFIIQGIELYPVNKVIVYNRWGNIVYQRNNYKNEWDGNSNVNKIGSNSLPIGTYYYLIDYGKDRHKTGFVYLDR